MLKIMLSAFLAWFFAELIKGTIRSRKEKKISLDSLYKSGGMPSAHSSTVSALSLAVYFDQGLTSLFIVTAIFSALVVRDTTLRIKVYRHKPIEVLAGVILGLLVSYLVYTL